MDKGEEAASELGEPSSNPPILFELLKETFNQVSLFVEEPVAGPGILVRLGRDAIIGSSSGNELADCFGPIGFVRQDDGSFQRYIRQGRFRFFRIMDIARRQVNVYRIAKTVNDCVNFRRFAASADSDMLLDLAAYRPFFAPALCWCASTLVLSMLISCRSASSPSSSKIFAKSPVFSQWVNRSYTVLFAPYRSGISAHGAPVLIIQRIPLSICRSSFLGLPNCPACRSGKYFLSRSHSESVISYRLRVVMPFHLASFFRHDILKILLVINIHSNAYL